MNYRTKRKRNKRKTKRMKGGTLEYNGRRHVFVGVNNTGRADAYLLNLLGVKLEPEVDPRQGIDLVSFYGNPETKIHGVRKSFRDYYLELDSEGQEGVRNFINFIKAERVNDRLRYLAKNPGAPLDSRHIHIYSVTSRLKDFINLIDPPLHKSGTVKGTFFNEKEKERFNEIYAGEFRELVGPRVPRIVLMRKFLELLQDLGKAPYERESESPEEVVEGLTQRKPKGAALEDGEVEE